MSKKKNINHSADKRAAKKAAVLGTNKKDRSPFIYIGILAVLLVAGGIFFAILKSKEPLPVAETTTSTVSASHVTFPVNNFTDGKARYFQFKADDGITIKYFILKSSDGILRAAFDACDVCWPAGKGYFQDGDFMVCRNCGRTFASKLVNVVKGGCNPAPLNRKVEGDEVVIQVADILEGKQYFDFSQRS